MAHFAQVIDGKVANVHVVANEVITDTDGVEQEELGKAFLAGLHGYNPDDIIQCSYNHNFRGRYPGVGFVYDAELDAFYPPQPYPSWVLNDETFSWEAPVPMPENGEYVWDEDAADWVEVSGG